MPHTFLSDDWIVSVLRDVETPDPPAKLFAFPGRAIRIWRWLAPAGLASAGALIAILLTLQPIPSLAQVAASQERVSRYTIVNTRFLTDGQQVKSLTYRDGLRWSVVWLGRDGTPQTRTVADGAKTITVLTYPPYLNEALLDDFGPIAGQSFDVKRFLRQGKPFTRTQVRWNGHAVDRFEAHSTYPGLHGTETFDQVIVADAHSHLPLRVEIFRDSRRWGDTWDYRYDAIAESVFETNVAATTPLFDLRAERVQLGKALLRGPVVLVDQGADVTVVIPDKASVMGSSLHVDGLDAGLQKDWLVRRKPITIGACSCLYFRIVRFPTESAKFTSLRQLSSTALHIGGKAISAVPVLKVGETGRLLRLDRLEQ